MFGVCDSRASDVFQNARAALDLNASYQLTKPGDLFFNAKKLTNDPLRFYEGSRNCPI